MHHGYRNITCQLNVNNSLRSLTFARGVAGVDDNREIILPIYNAALNTVDEISQREWAHNSSPNNGRYLFLSLITLLSEARVSIRECTQKSRPRDALLLRI